MYPEGERLYNRKDNYIVRHSYDALSSVYNSGNHYSLQLQIYWFYSNSPVRKRLFATGINLPGIKIKPKRIINMYLYCSIIIKTNLKIYFNCSYLIYRSNKTYVTWISKTGNLKRLPARKTANKHLSVINRAGVFHQMNID